MKSRLVALVCAILMLAGAETAHGYANGKIPSAALDRIVLPQPCAKLTAGAAAAYNTLQLHRRQTLPTNGCQSSYRDYDGQVIMRAYWCARGRCGNAAVPGTSNHGLGIAVDVPWTTQNAINRSGRPFGWCKCWSDAAWEPWHFRWRAGVWRKRPNPGPDWRNPILRRGSGGYGQRGAVKRAQIRVNRHVRKDPLRLTGEFNSKTRWRVKLAQEGCRLSTSGVIGKQTWKCLRSTPRRSR